MKINLSLDTDKSKEFIVIGIACHLKEYKFCWLLNNTLEINLGRINDYHVKSGGKNETKNIFPVFYYEEPSRQEQYFLIGNHGESGSLIQRTEINYLLFIQDLAVRGGTASLLEKIKKTSQVLTAFQISMREIPAIDYILSDIELLLLEHQLGNKNKK
jgi:hypothetical protein